MNEKNINLDSNEAFDLLHGHHYGFKNGEEKFFYCQSESAEKLISDAETYRIMLACIMSNSFESANEVLLDNQNNTIWAQWTEKERLDYYNEINTNDEGVLADSTNDNTLPF